MSVDNKTALATNAGEQSIEWPKKLNEMHNHHMDSEMWKDFQFRDDDIVISTYGKSGTTWMQQIVAQLIFNGELTHNGQGLTSL
jgi:aryl sulfotransferase